MAIISRAILTSNEGCAPFSRVRPEKKQAVYSSPISN